MTEEKTKKRGWVKNAAIIFLSVLLVLTFLSNTIMNHSLPEVAAQYVSSGSVTTRIRGTGTVTANENYEVKLSQSRKVQSVAVRLGDEVSVGDTLLYLSGEESTELQAAQDELDSMELNYQKALISATGSDYAKENRDIQNARTALQDAEAERDAISYSEEALANAKAALDDAKAAVGRAQNEVNAAQVQVDAAQEHLDALGGLQPGTGGGDYTPVSQAKAAWDSAKVVLEAITLQYGTEYDKLTATAKAEWNKSDKKQSESAYIQFVANRYSAYAPKDGKYPVCSEVDKDGNSLTAETCYKQYLAYVEMTKAQKAVDDAKAAYDAAYATYSAGYTSGNEAEWNRRNTALTNAKNNLTQMQKLLTEAEGTKENAQTAYDKIAEQKQAKADAIKNVKTCQTTLEDLIFALQEQQKQDGIQNATTALDLNAQREAIEEKRADIAKMRGDSNGQSVTSSVAGTVKTIGVSAGDTAQPDTALITIEVGDRGYSLTFSVTTEQSRKLSVGDTAEVSNYYWGGDINATLTGMRADPENPQSNKLLTFDISGDVETGTQLTLSVGQRSSNYDMVVPNSALRSDANGDFVLIVVAKSSPLGNRYVAQRADVKILAADDTNTAVSGALVSGDYVITTATAPIEAGMLVRMAESN